MALKILSFSYVIFILILILSSFLDGALGLLFYFLSFIIPIALAMALGKKSGEMGKLKIKMSAKNTLLMLPTVAPTLLAIIGISALSSFLFGLFGVYNQSITDVSGNIFIVIFRHAVLPSILEEILFRYVPIALLLNTSPKAAIFSSGVFFAFSHCNLFQLPYALFAGFAFATLDVVFDSITPSLVLHLLNNVLSVFYLRYGEFGSFKLIYFISLSVLSVISLLALLFMRDKYLSKNECLKNGNERVHFGVETLIFLVATSFIALITA